MKTLTRLTTCLIFLLSSQTFSQDTVMSSGGFGGPDSGSVDVPSEGSQSDDPYSSGNNDNSNSAHTDQSSSCDTVNPSSLNNTPTASTTVSVSYQTVAYNFPVFDLIRSGKENRMPSGYLKEWRFPQARKVRTVNPEEKFRARVNKQGNINSSTRTLLTNKDSDIPRCANKRGNSTETDRPNDIPPQIFSCECCCHLSSSREITLTKTSYEWDRDSTQDRTRGDNRNGRCGSEKGNEDTQSTSIGIPPEPKISNDDSSAKYNDCNCDCDCREPKGFTMFD